MVEIINQIKGTTSNIVDKNFGLSCLVIKIFIQKLLNH